MKMVRKTLKPTSICLSVLMLLICAPVHSAMAAMIGTESVMTAGRGQEARVYIHQLLVRDDVKSALIAHGIDPMEAKARIDSLSDAEIIRIADRIEQLPAGGDAISFLIVVILVLFLVLVILDLTGVTDVFPFIKSQR